MVDMESRRSKLAFIVLTATIILLGTLYTIKLPVKSDILRSTQIDLRIIVLTYNREKSLNRLLKSLNKAEYDNAAVVLQISIDRSKTGEVHNDTVEAAERFNFIHGEKKILVQPNHASILRQWVTTWKPPENDKEIAVILEDDLTVSPYFWKYLKLVYAKYGHIQNVNGVSLVAPGFKFAADSKELYFNIDAKHPVYLYTTLGTWGFSPNRKNWFPFVDWVMQTYNHSTFEPFVPNHKTSKWYKEGLKSATPDSVWEMWHIYWAWKHQEYTLYPNFPDKKGFVFNWLENGLHYHGKAVNQENLDFNKLVQEWKPEYNDLPSEPIKVDNYGNIMPQ